MKLVKSYRYVKWPCLRLFAKLLLYKTALNGPAPCIPSPNSDLWGWGHPIFLIFPGHPEFWTPLQIPIWRTPWLHPVTLLLYGDLGGIGKYSRRSRGYIHKPSHSVCVRQWETETEKQREKEGDRERAGSHFLVYSQCTYFILNFNSDTIFKWSFGWSWLLYFLFPLFLFNNLLNTYNVLGIFLCMKYKRTNSYTSFLLGV